MRIEPKKDVTHFGTSVWKKQPETLVKQAEQKPDTFTKQEPKKGE